MNELRPHENEETHVFFDVLMFPRLPTTINLIGFTESTKDFTLQKPGQPFFKWSWKPRGLDFLGKLLGLRTSDSKGPRLVGFGE